MITGIKEKNGWKGSRKNATISAGTTVEMEKSMQVMVLGAGMVGSAIVRYLGRETHVKVTAVDSNEGALERLASNGAIRILQADLLAMESLETLVSGSDLVICAVPGFMGFEMVKKVIEAGKNVVDISFFPEDPFLLDDLAREKGVTAIIDCGVAPGLCNIIAGHVTAILDQVDTYACYVGGLPLVRTWPFEYKAVFSPVDVLEEYTRLCRMREGGREVVKPALSDPELLDFPSLGTLEAFNTDGLRTLRKTLALPFMKEKTLRYPGHANLMRIFRESGFLDADPVEIDGSLIRPVTLTSQLLFDQWRLGEGEEDVTIMRVLMEGRDNGRKVTCVYDLEDRYDKETRTTAMARTTGYTAAIIARQVLEGLFDGKGICPPEFIGRKKACFENLLDEYEKQHILLNETMEDEREER
jgi:lysine 6-dehydrogenase